MTLIFDVCGEKLIFDLVGDFDGAFVRVFDGIANEVAEDFGGPVGVGSNLGVFDIA